MNKRDSQRSRVYGWERSAFRKRQWHATMTLEECQAFADRVWKSERGRYGLANTIPPHITWGRNGGKAFIGDRKSAGMIRLSPEGRNEIVLLHEIAHLLARGDGHGPRFVGCLIGLWARQAGYDAQTLLDQAAEAGVRVDARSIGAVPDNGLAARVELQLPGTAIELAVLCGVSYRQIAGAALHLIRKGRARWYRGRLVQHVPEPKPKRRPAPSPNSVREIAKRYGIEIERLYDGGWMVYPPDGIEGDSDPHDGDHFAGSWSEVRNMVREYADLKESTIRE